jgi:hypothetical protein
MLVKHLSSEKQLSVVDDIERLSDFNELIENIVDSLKNIS